MRVGRRRRWGSGRCRSFLLFLFRDRSLPSLLATVCAFKRVWSPHAWDGGRGGEKLGITDQTSAVGSVSGALLAFNFNRDKFLCILFLMYNGWGFSAVRLSIILIGLL